MYINNDYRASEEPLYRIILSTVFNYALVICIHLEYDFSSLMSINVTGESLQLHVYMVILV